MAQVILYTGKGEVGKTTMATAIARYYNEIGRRTTIPGTDTSYSLADSLDVSLDNGP